MRGKHSARRIAKGDVLPTAVVERRLAPARYLLACVVVLACIEVARHDGRFVRFPTLVAYNRLAAAVVIGYLYLADKARRAERTYYRPAAVVISAAYHRTHGILAAPEQVGDVVQQVRHLKTAGFLVNGYMRVVLQIRPRAVVGEVGHENVVTWFCSVHIEFEITEARYVGFGRLDSVLYLECLAQHGHRRRVVYILVFLNGILRFFAHPGSAYPFGLPAFGRKANAEFLYLAPLRRLAFGVPRHHAPVIAFALFQRLALIGY